MQHVFPEELAEFVENIIAMIGDNGVAVVDTKWREGKTIRYDRRSWAHDAAVINELVSAWGAQLTVANQFDQRLPLEGEPFAKRGMLRIKKPRA